MEKSIFRYILRYTTKDQILILVLTVLSLPLLYATLEVPKLIINDAIGGANLPDSLFGYPLDQLSYLLVLCLTFLVLVVINGGIKYVLNVYRGVVGERMLRRLRYDLYCRVLRFPLPHFKKVSQGEVIPIITAETEPLGGFIGEAFALPAFQGGILFTYLFFIFNQDILLGIVATALYPFQLYIIPKLQRKVNALGKQRVLAARKLGDRIGDTISGIDEIHAHDTSRYERAVISERLGKIYQIRFDIYKKKFFIKFLNNFLAQVTPFFFYLFGGYYIIQGELSLGALVAVLAAYKDLSSPWKELLKYYQTREDVKIKYEQIIEQFQPAEMMEKNQQDAPPLDITNKQGAWEVFNLNYSELQGIDLIERLSFTLGVTSHTAIVGIGASGKEELGQLLSRLLQPSQGKLNFAGMDMRQLPESVIGRHIAHVGNNAHHFSGSIRDNLIYSLRHRQLSPPESTPDREKVARYSLLSGNTTDVPDGVWIDEEGLVELSGNSLADHIQHVLEVCDFSADVFRLGLLGRIDSASESLQQQILDAREHLRQRLQEKQYVGVVELFEWDSYNTNLTVLENILFSPSKSQGVDLDQLGVNECLNELLKKLNLLPDLVEIGRQVAKIMVDLFSDVDQSSDLFERFSFISADELSEYRELLKQTEGNPSCSEDTSICERFLALTFRLCPARHRLGLIDDVMQKRILQARFALVKAIEGTDIELTFFDSAQFNSDMNIQDNMLFGKPVYGLAMAETKVAALVQQVVCVQGLESLVIQVGLDYQVGTAGTHLSLAQRQKLAIARALVKNPDVVILNEATAGLDPAAETRVITNLRAEMAGRGLIYITSRANQARDFEHLLVLENGRLIEQGNYIELKDQGVLMPKLLGRD